MKLSLEKDYLLIGKLTSCLIGLIVGEIIVILFCLFTGNV